MVACQLPKLNARVQFPYPLQPSQSGGLAYGWRAGRKAGATLSPKEKMDPDQVRMT